MPYRHEGGKRVRIDSWEGHVEQSIREAQKRGEFDNLPGTGKPLDLEENPFAGERQSAFRMARNAGAAPLWVQLDREIASDLTGLREMAERTARHLRYERARLELAGPDAAGAAGTPARRSWWRRLLFGAAPTAAGERFVPRTLADLEGERRRARGLYLKRAAEVDGKIKDFNSYRPRNLTWLEKTRLLPDAAARDFDALCPPLPA